MDISNTPLAEERLLLARFLLRLIGITRGLYAGESCTDTLIRVAVIVGTLEGRPLSAAKIADYVKVPRETVRRRLAVMERRGIVDLKRRKASIRMELLLDRKREAATRETLALLAALSRSLAQIEHKKTSQQD